MRRSIYYSLKVLALLFNRCTYLVVLVVYFKGESNGSDRNSGGDTPLHYGLRNNKSLLVVETLAKGSSREVIRGVLAVNGVEGTCLQMAEKYQLKDVINFIQLLL